MNLCHEAILTWTVEPEAGDAEAKTSGSNCRPRPGEGEAVPVLGSDLGQPSWGPTAPSSDCPVPARQGGGVARSDVVDQMAPRWDQLVPWVVWSAANGAKPACRPTGWCAVVDEARLVVVGVLRCRSMCSSLSLCRVALGPAGHGLHELLAVRSNLAV